MRPVLLDRPERLDDDAVGADAIGYLGVCFHAGSSTRVQFPAYKDLSPGLAAALSALTRPVSSVMVVANFLYSRILMRYPTLKVVFAESSLAWGAYGLETADHQFERQRRRVRHDPVGDVSPAMLYDGLV